MSLKVACTCTDCKKLNEWAAESRKYTCNHCGKLLGEIKNPDDMFDTCPMCESRQFYIMKDFDKLVGCTIVLVGIVLVPVTYGLSLPFFALVDWIVYKKVPSSIVCYRCGCEFKGFKNSLKRFKPFMHHIGLKYDKFR